jgi:hypothetical protein
VHGSGEVTNDDDAYPTPLAPRRFRKSTYSAPGCSCVEVAKDVDVVAVRDSKAMSSSPVLSFSPESWKLFISAVRDGSLAQPTSDA